MRSAMNHLMCGIYGLVLVVMGIVFPVSAAITEGDGYTNFIVQVFHLYLYMLSLMFLAYLQCCLEKCSKPRSNHKANNINLVSNNQLDVSIEKPPENPPEGTEENEVNSHKDHEEQEEMEPMFTEPETPGISYDSEGVNFYLRLGAIGFGTGAMIHDGFRIAQIFESSGQMPCDGPMFILLASMHLVFTFFQTFFLFKSHKIVINVHKPFVRFCLMHIVATNICVWTLTVIMETNEAFREQALDKLNGEKINSTTTSSPNIASMFITSPEMMSCFGKDTLAREAAPYLFPCTIEYSLIAAAIVYRMYRYVGVRGKHEVNIQHEDYPSRSIDCHKAHRGLFLGLFIAILTFIGISCFFVFDEKDDYVSSIIFYVTELALLSFAFVAVLLGFCRFQKLQFTMLEDGPFDVILLVVGFFGICIFNTFLIISSADAIVSTDNTLTAILSLTVSGLTLIQASIQTIFILDGLRRCAGCSSHVRNKPGRAIVTFLLLCNLSLWAVNTFEVEKADVSVMHLDFYGLLPWNMITHFCIPLLIFFRFHSTVCLSDIWINAYIFKSKEL